MVDDETVREDAPGAKQGDGEVAAMIEQQPQFGWSSIWDAYVAGAEDGASYPAHTEAQRRASADAYCKQSLSMLRDRIGAVLIETRAQHFSGAYLLDRIARAVASPSQQGDAREREESPEFTGTERARLRRNIDTLHAQLLHEAMKREGLEREIAALRSAPVQGEDHSEAYAALAAIRERHNGYNAEMRAAMPDLKEPASPAEALDDLLEEERELATRRALARAWISPCRPDGLYNVNHGEAMVVAGVRLEEATKLVSLINREEW
jgi:hypothetical protein